MTECEKQTLLEHLRGRRTQNVLTISYLGEHLHTKEVTLLYALRQILRLENTLLAKTLQELIKDM